MNNEKKIKIEINGNYYIIDFLEKKLFDLNNNRVSSALNLLKSYVQQNDLGPPKNHNNHSYIGVIKKHLLSKEGNSEFGDGHQYSNNIGKIIFNDGNVDVDAFIKHNKEYKTNITDLIKNVEHLIDLPKQLEINKSLFEPKDIYNSYIRKHVDIKPGVYIWYDHHNYEVLYIGMAGKIKTNGELTNHPIRQRLQAPRCRDKHTKKDVLTNKYISEVLKLLKIPSLQFILLFSKENEPAAHIESVLLYNYYKQHKVLPILNNAF
jgi:hypothetical protein